MSRAALVLAALPVSQGPHADMLVSAADLARVFEAAGVPDSSRVVIYGSQRKLPKKTGGLETDD